MNYAELSPQERDRLRAAFDAGFSIGSGLGKQLMGDGDLDELMDELMHDWFTRREIPPTPPEWLRIYAERREFETARNRGER